MSLLETAAGLGELRAVELAAFAKVGEAALASADAAAARYLAGASLAHAWRAGQLEPLLPVSVGLPSAESLTVVGPGPLAAALSAALDGGTVDSGGDAPSDDGRALVDRLADGLYPALLAAYDQVLDAVDEAAAPPVRRTVRRVVADLEATVAEGKGLTGKSAGGSGRHRPGRMGQ